MAQPFLRKPNGTVRCPFLTLFSQFLISLAGGQDGILCGGTEATLLQCVDTGNGAAAGRADFVLQLPRVLTAPENHLCGTGEHLCP